MLEGIIVFIIGYICGIYNDKVKAFISKQIDKIFQKNEKENDNE